MKYYLSIFLLFIYACTQDDIGPNSQSKDLLWLEYKGAQMPIWVEGNTASNTMVIIIHGGPGGNALIYNETSITMATELEKRYGVAYWDQRSSGNSRGSFDKEDLTVELMAEDLDLVIDLLQDQYGPDLDIILLGHSWGGYLGSYYLLEPRRQAKVKGWIDVDGAHNIPGLTRDALVLMEEVSREQIAGESDNQKQWEEILDFVEGFDLGGLVDVDAFVEVNIKAIKAEKLAFSDGLTAESDEDPGEILNGLLNYFFGKHHPLTGLSNKIQLNQTQLLEEAIDNPLSDELFRITTPSLLLWGQLDFIVPPNQGFDAYNNLGTPENQKRLVLFEGSGHSPMSNEPDRFVDEVVGFIEELR